VRQGNNRQLLIMTSFGVTTATNEITQNGVTNSKTDQISARSIVLPNMFYASYEALAARLAAITVPADLPVYVAPQTEIRAAIKAVTPQEIRVAGGGVIQSRIFDVTFQNPNGPLETKVTIDDRGRFLRLDVPAQQLAVYRSDIATVSTRFDTFRNPTDGDVTIPSSGFNIAGTLTMPPGEGKLKHPSIVLVAGSGPYGRDELVAGTPIFAQLAGALAQQGFAVLRYDKRGIGQSGGRSERATLQDYADDLNAAIKWMSKRRDFDSRRIAVVGHSEGGAVAMLAAAREKKIASVVLVAAPGSTGAALVLEQQKHLLEVAKAPEEERKAKIQLQEKIQQAVMTDTGWEGIPPELRAQAESTLFRSMLLFDPAKVMPKVKQPILIVQGDLDKQVFPHHADTLGELARARKKAGPVELVHLSGVNHLLVPATTGEVSEYASLPEKTISPVVPKTIGEWLKK
jgi:pimeloyl-ACP methyl ester carboxylesterase